MRLEAKKLTVVVERKEAGVIVNAVDKVDEGVGEARRLETGEKFCQSIEAGVIDNAVDKVDEGVGKVVKLIIKSIVEAIKLPEKLKLYLRLTPKNLMRLLPKKLIKLSN